MKSIADDRFLTAIFGELNLTFKALRNHGVTPDHLKKIRIEPDYAKRVAEFMIQAIIQVDLNAFTCHKRAQEIMGKNFFGVEKAIKYFGVNPTKQQITALLEIPFSEVTLEQCKKTHILVAIFPLSIIDIHGKVRDQHMLYSQDWQKESFAHDREETKWQLVRKTPINNSTLKNWQKQQALLGKNEETPKTRVMVYTIIGHFLATYERLFEKIYIRCSDVNSDGYRVYVGNFDFDGLRISYVSNGSYRVDLGLTSARKSE